MAVGQAELGREGVSGRGTSKANTEGRSRIHLRGGHGGEGGGSLRPPSGSPAQPLGQWGAMEGCRARQGHPVVCFRKIQLSCPSLTEMPLCKYQMEDKSDGYFKITNL